jgi:CRP/FNR family cyclic AMP-dependent transcriptional regulator
MAIMREAASENLPALTRHYPSMEGPWAETQAELNSLKTIFDCPSHTTLFVEDALPARVLYLLEGRVKLSLNSSSGRRLILGISQPGDTLGLAASLCGSRFDASAETLSRCKLASIDRKTYLDFLARHPAAYKNVVRELCLDRARAHEQLRTMGLAAKAPARLARLLLEWCDDGLKTNQGTRLTCSFTHGEIGEFIGASRETVSRIFSEFKDHDLLRSNGSTLIISNVKALQAYAGIEGFN